jgi:hypothetical protein
MNAIQDLLVSHSNNTLVVVTTISAIGVGLLVGYGILSRSRSSSSTTAKNMNKTSKSSKNTDTKPIKLDESDDNILKGYKETSDGKKTSYFHRELSEEEKSLIGDTTPKRIDSSNPSVDNSPKLLSKSPSGSPWNAAGTYEEKDISQWVIPKLTKIFSDIQYAVNGQDINNSTCKACSVLISSVTNVEGDALFAVARGKRKYILDMRADLDWKVLPTSHHLYLSILLINYTYVVSM